MGLLFIWIFDITFASAYCKFGYLPVHFASTRRGFCYLAVLFVQKYHLRSDMFIEKIAYWQKKCQVLKIFKIDFSSRKKFYKIYLSCLQNASFSRITDSTSRALFKIQVVVTKLKLVWCLGHAKYSRVLIKSSRSRGVAVKFCKNFSDLKNRF